MTSHPVVSRRVRLQAQPDRLDSVHGALEHFWSAAEDRGAAPEHDTRMQFDLAVIEVAANILEHARPTGGVTLELEVALYPDHIDAVFHDNGGQVLLSGQPELPADDAESGRGLAIVERAVDEVRYERSADDVNVWRLRKRLRSAPPVAS